MVYCIRAWSHLHYFPNSKVIVCDLMSPKSLVGNLQQHSLSEVFYGNEMEQARKQFQSGEIPKECFYCVQMEKSPQGSFRERFSREFIIQENRPTLQSLDMAFSNNCNLRCRQCGPYCSTSWYQDADLMTRPRPKHEERVFRDNEELERNLKPHIPTLKRIFISGGEPLLDRQHIPFLQFLQREKCELIHLFYNSNMCWDGELPDQAIEIWKYFPKVTLGMSLDGSGTQFELLRKNGRWEAVLANLKKVRIKASHVHCQINTTISFLNIFHLPRAIAQWVSEDVIRECSDWGYTILREPEYLQIGLMSEEEFKRFELILAETLPWIKQNARSDLYNELSTMLNSIKDFIVQDMKRLSGRKDELRSHFRKYTIVLDKIRGERFVENFPEHFGVLYSDATTIPRDGTC